MLQNLVMLIIALLGFSVLIVAHEFGHCIAAKRSGVQVNEFWIGMGPDLWSKQIGETRYCLKLLPIGGACVMEGEEQDSFSPRSYQKASRGKRFLILIAGVTMNFLLGYVLLLALYLPLEGSFLDKLTSAFWHAVYFAQLIWQSVHDLLTGAVGVDQLSGPVGVTSVMMDAVSYGIRQFTALVSFISINLGVMNLLPIPGLDGGRLLFLGIEAVRRKPMRQEIEGYVNAAFMLALFALILYATGNDILRLLHL